MPGYRTLAATYTGSAADSAREAEALRREGDAETAVTLLEEALEASCRITPELPGWLCGRLAALYRTIGRYDDEVALLERYRESQTSEDARSRYDARLSKARTIADRKRRSDSGALSSVRKVLRTPRRRGTQASFATILEPPAALDFQGECVRVVGGPADSEYDARLDAMLTEQCALAREAQMPVERLVQALKAATRDPALDHLTAAERDARYSDALLRLLAAYFEEGSRS